MANANDSSCNAVKSKYDLIPGVKKTHSGSNKFPLSLPSAREKESLKEMQVWVFVTIPDKKNAG
jgi:hypothetical protein